MNLKAFCASDFKIGPMDDASVDHLTDRDAIRINLHDDRYQKLCGNSEEGG